MKIICLDKLNASMIKVTHQFVKSLTRVHSQIIGCLNVNLSASLKWLPKINYFIKLNLIKS